MIRSFLAMSACSLTLCVAAFSAGKGTDSPSPQTVVAEVNGTKVTLGELEQKRADNLFQAENNYYMAKRTVLLDFIDEMLLRKQAEKEGLTVDQLIDKHVKSKLPKDPSDEAMRVYYEGVETQEPYEAMRGRILESIRQGRLKKATAAYMESLRHEASIVVSLPPPRADLSLEKTPVLGARNAPVMFVEFADYECPYCQQMTPTLQKLQTEYKGKVAFAFKDTPLPMHSHAEKAAEAAHCAGAQGKYWEYHDTVFGNKKLEIADLKQDARDLKLDTAAFEKCLDSGAQAEAVRAELEESQKLGLQGTPVFFLNGRMLNGVQSYEQLRKAIDQELAVAQQQTKETTTTASR